jgi:hypothetical protein
LTALVITGVASLLCWAVVLVAGLLRTRASDVEPGPLTLVFGDESPALVNLLVHRWRPTRDAIVATLVDLAARNVVTFEQSGSGTLIRVPQETPKNLRSYERTALEQVAGSARDGMLPAAALVRGKSQPDLWREFRKQVIAEARELELSQPRWSSQMLAVLNAVSLLPGAMVGLIVARIPDSYGEGGWLALAIFAGLVLWERLYAFAAAFQSDRDTPAGSEAAARWLGYRQYVAANDQFKTLPPTAVDTWERHLAYAAAFGMAQKTSQTLPMGIRDDRWAWSAFGGTWHRVRISYPRAWSWGKSPLRMTFHGLWRTTLGAAGALSLMGLQRSGHVIDLNKLVPVFGASHHTWIYPAGIVLGALLFTLGAVNLVLAIGEWITRREHVGEILRLRPGYVAITDGRSPATRAYRLAGVTNWKHFREGVRIRVTAGLFLGYVVEAGPARNLTQQESHPAQ